MHSIDVVLAMLLAVAASGYLIRILPFSLPLPLVQIALGAVVSGVFDAGHELEPELFFLLFLPPLLFLDGWRIPKQGLFRDKAAILELALGLVIFTVIGAGFFIHWLIPAMPLAVAFALAAIISPTDPVAVSSIASKVPIPKRLMHILEGESLLNDASGLVCFQFAVAAVLTGTFSVAAASLTFLWVALAGLALGVATTFGLSRIQAWIWRHFGEEPGSAILVNLLTPFAAYLLAEAFHASGILAAVAAGVTMSYVEMAGNAPGNMRLQRSAVWDTVQFTFNGIIFVLLGEQLPGILDGAVRSVQEAGHLNPWWLAVYVATISASLMALRFVWVFLSLRWNIFKAQRRGEAHVSPPWRIVVAVSLAGVRGAITLAGVLTLPLMLEDGSPFPARQLAIFLAASVILVSLLVASVALPRLLRGLELPEEEDEQLKEDLAVKAASQAALDAVEKLRQRLVEDSKHAERYNAAANQVSQRYQRKLGAVDMAETDPEEAVAYEKALRQFRHAALVAERNELFKLARRREISDDLSRRLVRNLDLIESRKRA
ncbi:sodium:proton antiporter [Xanthomonas phaseoli pv. phaseoli]|uniref:Na+/H+ antiporter n=5 Tax=Xanthomonas TaxID=338 RepID=A0AAX0HYU5_XANCG|nr:Na+:H+ antiporter [Xanthomonas citri subsp. citri Aw12879]AJZ46457.1 Na+/H+ antiporter, bacterial form [Xanthomonas citri pv. citri]AOY64784.1 Na+/H+ antiporter [Xanthomonas citri pv. glycines str. 8ra]ARV24761.1 Na+/H+ antiporter [Xanthomonas citri pv. glycines str. 12-2]KGU57990.1 sodium:proton antiporter [Xanthomonas phaseoli pv. phaseoli]OEY89482.1 Na+/H+ antiporter [Xanthomonas citri pv. glycines]OOX09965.1 sodium:proton antiporter [Xanthomonas axonopodis pv. cajani]